MSQPFKLNYFILLDQGSISELNVQPGQRLFSIRKAIYKEHKAYFDGRRIDELHLRLFKPENLAIEEDEDESALNERVKACIVNQQAPKTVSLKERVEQSIFGLKPLDSTAQVLCDDFREDSIHLVVAVSHSRGPVFGRSRSSLAQSISLREAVVSGIWEKLKKYRFIWARGTPGSGKSILANLLQQHIVMSSPEMRVIMIVGWTTTWAQTKTWKDILVDRGWVFGVETVFIFDEAQQTYNDRELWNAFLKSIRDYDKVYAIGFASYGSALSRFEVCKGTPTVIPSRQRITLRPVDHYDGLPAVGLLFTKEDFDDAVVRKYKDQGGHSFDETFLNELFGMTGGHIGATVDILQIIEASEAYRVIKRTPDLHYSCVSFRRDISPQVLMDQIKQSASIFSRGLPRDEDLQGVEVSRALSIVAQKTVVKTSDASEDILPLLQQCALCGWLHTDSIVDGEMETFAYFFASSLHQWYTEWKLFVKTRLKAPNESNVKDFVLAVIRKFSPQILREERRIGAAYVQRPFEAQFQDEFHRCSHAHSGGSVVTFPEFGTGKGRADFYVPSKKWGIELLRDGDQLEQHSLRFSQPSEYRADLLDDYVILDCRTTIPRIEHRSVEKLYYVVFVDSYQRVTVLDNRKQVIDNFNLRL